MGEEGSEGDFERTDSGEEGGEETGRAGDSMMAGAPKLAGCESPFKKEGRADVWGDKRVPPIYTMAFFL